MVAKRVETWAWSTILRITTDVGVVIGPGVIISQLMVRRGNCQGILDDVGSRENHLTLFRLCTVSQQLVGGELEEDEDLSSAFWNEHMSQFLFMNVNTLSHGELTKCSAQTTKDLDSRAYPSSPSFQSHS